MLSTHGRVLAIGGALIATLALAGCVSSSTSPPVTVVATPMAADPLASCGAFSAGTVWHAPINGLPVDANSERWKTGLGGNATNLGVAISSQIYQGSRPGFPINVVDSRTAPMRTVHYYEYGAYSYNGLFPMPDNIRVESDPLPLDWWVQRPSDDHILGVDVKDCSFYELFKINTGVWAASREVWASSGARWNLADGKTQGFGTNAAQVPYPGITMRLAEVQRGRVDHMIGACTNAASPGFTWPARGSDGPNPSGPPMGSRLRLKGSTDISKMSGQGRVIASALRDYGIILYDTCASPLQIAAENVASGWNDAELAPLKSLTLGDFEVVDQTPLKVSDTTWAVK